MNKAVAFFGLVFLVFCTPTVAEMPSSTPPNHKDYDAILKKYVDDKGMVNYAALRKDREPLRNYLSNLAKNAPNSNWTKNEKLAYWINAYNAYTLDLILENYPLESIKDLGSKIQVPFVNTAWDIKFIEIAGKKYDLNNIEHGIIRNNFDEPRIHFALVCAAVSCPRLRNEAYLAEMLDEQLTAAAQDFLSDSDKNLITNSRKVSLSKIFSWYGGDFKKKMSMVEYINKYSEIKLDKGVEIDFLDYNWALNEQ